MALKPVNADMVTEYSLAARCSQYGHPIHKPMKTPATNFSPLMNKTHLLRRLPFGTFALLLVLPLLVGQRSLAATRTSIAGGGLWGDTATWGGNPVPIAGDAVVIASATATPVVCDVDTPAIATLTINASSKLTINDGKTVTVTGNITQSGTIDSSATILGGGTLKLTTSNSAGQTLGAGTYGVNVDVATTGSGYVQLSISFGTNIVMNSPFTFTVENGAVAQSANKSLTGTGNFNFKAGSTLTCKNGNNGNILQLSGTKSFDPGANVVLIGNGTGNTTTSGTYFPSTVNDLTVNVASPYTATLSSSITVNGTLTLTSGPLAVGTSTLTLNGPAIAGTPGNLATTSSSSLVFGGGSSGVSVPSSVTALNNLTIGNGSGVTLGGNLAVAGTLTINANSILNDGGNTLTAQGASIVNNGTWSGNGKLLVAGAISQTLNAGEGQVYGNVEVANTAATVFLSPATFITVNSPNTFVVNSGATVQSQNKWIQGTGNIWLKSGATFAFGNATAYDAGTGFGAIRVSGTRTFEPGANYIILGNLGNCTMGSVFPSPMNNLTINLSGTATLSSSVQVNGALDLASGTLDIAASGTLLANGTSTGSGAVTVSGGTLGGSGAVNGTVTVGGTGTVRAGTSAIGTLTLASAPTLNGTVSARLNATNTPTADKLMIGSGTLNYGGTLALTNLGPTITNGQTFTLFNASAYSGTFTTITPGSTTHWKTNNLFVDGSISFTNTPPVALPVTNMVAQGGSIAVTNNPGKNAFASDADADSLAFTVVSGPAAGTVSDLAGGFVYTSTGTPSNQWDSFQYAVDDGYGGAATNTIALYIGSPLGANLISATESGGFAYLTYAGVPGQTYVSERATNLTPPIAWSPVATNTAGATNSVLPGRVFFTNAIVSPASFFRTQAP